MAQQLQIPDEDLYPGDFVDVEYEIRGTNGTLVSMAVGRVKEDLSHETRFHYQGSEIQERDDQGDNQTHRYLIITVQVADPSKVTGNHPDVVVYEASIVPVAIIVTAIAGSIGAVAAFTYLSISKITILKGAQINKEIAQDPTISDEVKIAAIGGNAKAASSPLVSVGSGAGIGLVAIVVGGILAYGLLFRRGRA